MPYSSKIKQSDYQNRRNKRLRMAWINKNGPCNICGSSENLEIDHVDPSLKECKINWSISEKRRNHELKKCQVLCNRCHKIKTVAQISKPVKHGTYSGYQYYKCRCDLCKKARIEYSKKNFKK